MEIVRPIDAALGEPNPAASSRSCPGVLMVTAKGRPSTRISRGSSTTTQSGSISPDGERCTLGTPLKIFLASSSPPDKFSPTLAINLSHEC